MGRLIYLDNAATSMTRPPEVLNAVMEAMGLLGNAGRGAGSSALDASRVVLECRRALAELFGCPAADRVCFTPNSTAALNIAIRGVVRSGDHVVTTVLEHNSVLRPLNRLAADEGVIVDHCGCDAFGRLNYDELERLVTSSTRAVVCTHASNVTGNVVDLRRVAQIAHERGALLVVDASQTAGCMDIDMAQSGIDVLCFTGHKGLMGPQGTGGLCVMPGVEVAPLLEGGTGVHSFDERHPQEWPTRLEAGTLNAHGIAGLLAAVRWICAHGGPAAIGASERDLATRFVAGLDGLTDVTLYGDLGQPERAAIVSVNVADMGAADVSDILMHDFNIATRAGAHCAPLMHRALGTADRGVVRFSFGRFNSEKDVDLAIDALRQIAS